MYAQLMTIIDISTTCNTQTVFIFDLIDFLLLVTYSYRWQGWTCYHGYTHHFLVQVSLRAKVTRTLVLHILSPQTEAD